jgi:glutathione S-transferase
MHMQWTAWITLGALMVYFWTAVNVGKARTLHKVPAPAMDGPLEFLCAVRVQANTVEQMVMFLPALWLCAYFLGDRWAAAGGALWIVGRIVYALGYYRAPNKRGPGFGISILADFALMAGAAIGLLMH